jgi:hypothetical protein
LDEVIRCGTHTLNDPQKSSSVTLHHRDFFVDSVVGDGELNLLYLVGRPTLKGNAGNLTEKGNDGDHSSQFKPVMIGWLILM